MNAAAWPPFVPTLRRVTAGLVVAVVAFEYSVATARRAGERVAVGGAVELDRVWPTMPAPGARTVSTSR